MRKGLVFINVIAVVFVVFAVVGLGSYFLVKKAKAPETQPTTLVPRAATTTDETAGWKTYRLDLSNFYAESIPITKRRDLFVSHNAAVILTLDMSQETRIVKRADSYPLKVIQTKETCGSGGKVVINDDYTGPVSTGNALASAQRLAYGLRGAVTSKDIAHIRNVKIGMGLVGLSGVRFSDQYPSFSDAPRVEQDHYVRNIYTFCVGFHTADNNWIWDFARVRPSLIFEDNLKMAIGEINVDARNVDAIAILFEHVTELVQIEFDAKRTDPFSTWKTYRNEKYGFEVKYPSEWRHYEYADTSSLISIFKPDRADISFEISETLKEDREQFIIRERQRIKELEAYLATSPGIGGVEYSDPEKILFAGREATSQFLATASFDGTVVVVPSRGLKITFGYGVIGELDKTPDKILSTFKFFEP